MDDPRDRKIRKELKAALEQSSPEAIAQDFALLDAVESASRSPLDIVLPKKLKKALYPAGARWLGMRTAIRFAAVLLLAGLSLQTLRILDRRVTDRMDRYRATLSEGVGLWLSETPTGIRISWSPTASAVDQARAGTLTVRDGLEESERWLSRSDLLIGSADYTPVSSDVSFELKLRDEQQNEVREQVRILLPEKFAKLNKVEDPNAHVSAKRQPLNRIAPTKQMDKLQPALADPPRADPLGKAIDRVLATTGVIPAVPNPKTPAPRGDNVVLSARQSFFAKQARVLPQRNVDVTPASPNDTAASVAETDGPHLALRFSLFDERSMQEIDPAKVFHSGDRFRLKLQANSDGYLYIVNLDSQGFTLIFPTIDEEKNGHGIKRGETVIVPSWKNFVFDAVPGEERLFVVLSRQREPDLDRLVTQGKSPQRRRPRILGEAQWRALLHELDAYEFDHLRSGNSVPTTRLETLRTSNGNEENAVYIASTDSNGARLVTEIRLKHE